MLESAAAVCGSILGKSFETGKIENFKLICRYELQYFYSLSRDHSTGFIQVLERAIFLCRSLLRPSMLLEKVSRVERDCEWLSL